MKLLVCLLVAAALSAVAAEPPRTLPQCLDLALQQNPAILKAKEELRRTRGLVVEAGSEAYPQVVVSGQASLVDENTLDLPAMTKAADNQRRPWNAKIEVTQLVYSGGRVNAGLRAAALLDEIAVLGFQRTVADTVLAVRRAFYQILLLQAQVGVREESIKLLDSQRQDVKHRFEAGTVPQFNVLRAEVELANARPPLIRTQNNLRLAREALAKLLALDTPGQTEFTDLRIAGALTYEHRAWALPAALTAALQSRAELQQAEKQVSLADQKTIAVAASGKPSVALFGNYGIHNYSFADDAGVTRDGWTIGARVTWPMFDGFLARGRVQQARAERSQAALSLDDARRGVELEVRQAYSDYRQARELIEAQQKTVAQAEESLRLAEARFKAGAGTQLDVLSAQTALTEARSNEIQALHDYNVANATLDRVTGVEVKRAP
jgi:outer membrane protein TolC